MSPLERELALREVERQMARFFTALDERDFPAMAAVMTEDGSWRRAGVDIPGRKGLLEVMAGRDPDRHSRHSLTNMIAEITGDGRARLRFYSTAWVHAGATEEDWAPMALPSSIGVYTAEYVLRDGAWLMERLTSKPAFKRARAAA